MPIEPLLKSASCLTAAGILLLHCGCLAPWKHNTHYVAQLPCAEPPPPLGSVTVDPFFQKQEENGEASDFVIYEHEFIEDSNRLNASGENHLRQIAARAPGLPYAIILEESSHGSRPETKHEFPVHNDPELDMQRRAVVVKALELMGVGDARNRVVVGPAFTPGYRSLEAQRAYAQGLMGAGFGGGGFGGGGMGF